MCYINIEFDFDTDMEIICKIDFDPYFNYDIDTDLDFDLDFKLDLGLYLLVLFISPLINFFIHLD